MALGAVIIEGKKPKGSNSKPTVMMSQLPLLLTDDAVRSILVIAARHYMVGVSGLSVRKMGRTKAAAGNGPPKKLGGHCSVGA